MFENIRYNHKIILKQKKCNIYATFLLHNEQQILCMSIIYKIDKHFGVYLIIKY
jgi:hypothetical protein